MIRFDLYLLGGFCRQIVYTERPSSSQVQVDAKTPCNGASRPIRSPADLGAHAHRAARSEELVHGRMMQAMRQEGEEPTGETSATW